MTAAHLRIRQPGIQVHHGVSKCKPAGMLPVGNGEMELLRMRSRIAIATLLGAVVVAAFGASSASAADPAPFGHACTAQNGVRFCPTSSSAQRVPTFDGVPLDADVTLPAQGDGPFPTIVMLHGWGGSKTDFESDDPNGNGSTTYHYNNTYYALHGYAVLNYTARGFGNSCGGGPGGDHSGACGQGYIRLADQRYEARDTQYLLGLLVDEGITRPNAIGVTGISYGGGQSMELAFLNDKIRKPNGDLAPWQSPDGTPLHIAAAYPRWPWSDLVDALLPTPPARAASDRERLDRRPVPARAGAPRVQLPAFRVQQVPGQPAVRRPWPQPGREQGGDQPVPQRTGGTVLRGPPPALRERPRAGLGHGVYSDLPQGDARRRSVPGRDLAGPAASGRRVRIRQCEDL